MNGSGDAIEDWYPPLWRYTAATCGTSYDADDVLQEAFARTLRHHRIEDLEYPGAYLRKVVMSVIASQARRRRRKPTDVLDHDVGTSNPVVYPSDLSDLLRLDPRDRAVLYLVDVEGCTFEEAAPMLGCSAAAARKRASRARHRLRTTLEEEP